MEIRRITVDEWRHVPSGERVEDGFGGLKMAPLGGGLYTLYELADEANIHRGWEWELEENS